MIRSVRFPTQQTGWQRSFFTHGAACFAGAIAAYGVFHELRHFKAHYVLQEIHKESEYQVQELLGEPFQRIPISQRMIRTVREYLNSRIKTAETLYHLHKLSTLSHHPKECQNYFLHLSQDMQGKVISSMMYEENATADRLLPILLVPKVTKRSQALIWINSYLLLGKNWTKKDKVLHQIVDAQLLDEKSKVRIMTDAIFYPNDSLMPFSHGLKMYQRNRTPTLEEPRLPTQEELQEEAPLGDAILFGRVFNAMLEANCFPNFETDSTTAQVILSDLFAKYASLQIPVENQKVLAACIGATLSTTPENLTQIRSAIRLLNTETPIPIHGNSQATQEALEKLQLRQPIVQKTEP